MGFPDLIRLHYNAFQFFETVLVSMDVVCKEMAVGVHDFVGENGNSDGSQTRTKSLDSHNLIGTLVRNFTSAVVLESPAEGCGDDEQRTYGKSQTVCAFERKNRGRTR